MIIKEMIFISCLILSLAGFSASFDRSAVEKENRYVPAIYPYSESDLKFTPVNVEYEPNRFVAKTKYGTYYGAAANPWFLKLLPQKNKDTFPLSKAEVQSKPQGISEQQARQALQLYNDQNYAATDSMKIVCYYEGWAVYRKSPMTFTVEDIDANMCTHLIYSFAGLKGNTIQSLDPEEDIEKQGFQKALDLKQQNPSLKVMIAIGGWNEGVAKYSKMASSAANRKEFVDSVVAFIKAHGFDGLDVDWEYPGDTERGGSWSDRENYSLLLEELKAAFGPFGWLLSAAVPAPKSRVDAGYDVRRIAQALDFINVMTYDLHGSWDGFADHHAPLYKRSHDYYPFNTLTVDFAMKYWAEKGAPKHKLIMGTPFYGRSFVLQNANKFKPGDASSGDGFSGEFTQENGFLAYFEICKLAKEPGWMQKKDDTDNVFIHNADKWIGYDDVANVERKMQYVRRHGYGGGMIWAIGLDDFNGQCGERWPLLKTINRVLNSDEPIEETEDISTVEVEQSEGQSFECPGTGTFGSPNDCQTYFQCDASGVAFQHKCPAGLLFNSVSKICDWPDNVQCDINFKSKDECSNVGLHADPYNCRMMYWCINGKKVQTSCPSGLFFDPRSASCHFYAAYRCLTTSTYSHSFLTVPSVPLQSHLLPYVAASEKSRFVSATKSYYAGANGANVVCYFANWAHLRSEPAKYVPENMDASLCTHIFYAYASLDSASFEAVPGEPMVDINDGYFSRIQSVAKSQNPGVKILLSIGGWTDSSGRKYSRLVNDASKRANFVKKAVEMLQRRNFDGLSLEWQYPVCWQSDCSAGLKSDRNGFVLLVKELKEAFEPEGLILAAGLSGYSDIAKEAYEVRALSQYLDMANVYAYDYHGYWDGLTNHHSPLKDSSTYNVDYIINYYTNNGFAKRQLNLGIPFYGQSYTMTPGSSDVVGQKSSGPGSPGLYSNQQGMLTFMEICSNVKGNWRETYVREKGAFAYGSNQWVSFNNVDFVKEKANYVKDNALGGVAVYTMDMDDFNNQCCQGPNPLLNALSLTLRGVGQPSAQGNCQKPAPVTTPAPPESSTGYDDGGRFEIKTTSQSWEWKPPATTSTTTKKPTTTAAPSQPSQDDGSMMQGSYCAENGQTFSHNDCQNYFRCVNNKLVLQQCTVGLLWDNSSGRCNWANLILCGSRTVPAGMLTRDSAPPPPVQELTTAPSSSSSTPCTPGSYQAVPGECAAYISCNTNGQEQKSYCSQGLHWNQATLACNWAAQSDCQDDPDSPAIYQNVYQAGSPCSNSGSMVSNPADCASFLICNHEAYIVQPCPAGLHWDEKIKACNTQEAAKCVPGSAPPVVEESVTQAATTASTTQWEWKPDNDNDGSYNPGQWEWKPPTTTTTETTFIETSNVQTPLSGDFKVVCYFTNWAWYRPGIGKYRPEDIDPTICTHVVYGFAVLDGSNLVIKPHDSWADLDNEFYKKVTALKRYGIKVTVAIGGWNDSLGSKYSRLVNNPAARAKFVSHVVDFIEKHDFDGLDLDWEYPKCWQVDCDKGPESDKQAFASWVSELKEAFRPKGYLLSAAVSPSKKVMDLGYDIPSIARDLDWIAVMSYDYHGHWDKKTGHVSPMYAHPEDDYDYFNTDFTIKYWMENGAPADKLVMGMPLYGQAFTLNSPQNNGLNAPANQKGQAGEFTRAAGFLAYYEICDMIKNNGWNVVNDDQGRMGPYAYNDRQWVGYDDVKMIRYKSNYIRKMGLAGGMVWALDLDDFKNRCGQGHHPLMNTIKEVLAPQITPDEQAARSKSVGGSRVATEEVEIDLRQPEIGSLMPKLSNNEAKVVCYFTNWAFYRPGSGKFLPEDIDVDLCTHVVYGFAVLNPRTLKIRAHDSWVDFDKEFYKRVTALKGDSRKVSLALGGWNDSQGDKYSRLVNNPTARKEFTEHVIEFLEKHNFDGLDLDWEYPTCWQVDCSKGPTSDKDGFADWVQELSSSLHSRGMILSSAMSPSAKVADKAYDIPRLNQYFDFVSIMTYDYHGQWDKKTGHVAPIYQHPDDFESTFNVNYTINYWLDKGMDKHKIIMGIPLYGQSFTLADRKNNGLNSKSYGGANAGKYTRSRGFLSYYEICDKVKNRGWQVVRDQENRMGPYAYRNNEWVSFDDVDTISQKIQLLKNYGLGGAMIWALDLDDFNNQCGNGKYPLLKTINFELGRITDYQRPDKLVTDENYIRTGLQEEEEPFEQAVGIEQQRPLSVLPALPYQYQRWPLQPLTLNGQFYQDHHLPFVTYNPKK